MLAAIITSPPSAFGVDRKGVRTTRLWAARREDRSIGELVGPGFGADGIVDGRKVDIGLRLSPETPRGGAPCRPAAFKEYYGQRA